MPTFKLPSVSPSLTGGSSSVRPSLFDTSSIRSGISPGGLRAPVSRQAQVPIPKVQEDRTLVELNKFGGVLVNSAIRVREKKDKLFSDEAVLEYNDYARKRFFGYDKEDGERVKGYKDFVGVDAVDEAYSYQEDVDKKAQEILGRLSPAQRQKAALRIANTRSVALNRGATWHSQQQNVAKTQALFVEAEDIRKEIAVNATRAWASQGGLPSMVDQHAAKYPDPKQAALVKGQMGEYTVFNAYNSVAENGGGAEDRYKAAREAYKMVGGSIPAKTKQYLRHWLGQKKDSLKADMERENKKAFQRQLVNLNSNASGSLIKIFATPGAEKEAVDFINVLYSANAGTKDGGQKVVRENLETSLYYVAVQSPEGIQAAKDSYEHLLDAGAKLDGNTFLRMREYIDIELPKKLDEFKDQQDVQRMGVYQDDIDALRRGEGKRENAQAMVDKFNATGPLWDNAETFRKAVFGAYKEGIEAHDDDLKRLRDGNAAVARGMLVKPGGPTMGDLNVLRQQVKNGTVDIKFFTQAQKTRLGADPVMAAIRSSDGYKNAYKLITTLRDKDIFFAFGEEDTTKARLLNAENAGNALTDLNNWAKEQHEKGVLSPNYGAHVDEYLENLNNTNPASRGFISKLFQPWKADSSNPNLLVKKSMPWIMGTESIMDEVAP